MKAAAGIASPSQSLREELDGLRAGQVQRVITAVQRVTQLHRERFLLKEPSAQESRKFERLLPCLIRLTQRFHCELLDPQFPHLQLARELEGALWQLEEIWASLQNSMTKTEADEILQSCFPE